MKQAPPPSPASHGGLPSVFSPGILTRHRPGSSPGQAPPPFSGQGDPEPGEHPQFPPRSSLPWGSLSPGSTRPVLLGGDWPQLFRPCPPQSGWEHQPQEAAWAAAGTQGPSPWRSLLLSLPAEQREPRCRRVTSGSCARSNTSPSTEWLRATQMTVLRVPKGWAGLQGESVPWPAAARAVHPPWPATPWPCSFPTSGHM